VSEEDLPIMLGAIFIAGAISAGLCSVVVGRLRPKPLLMFFVLGWGVCLISISVVGSKSLFFVLVITGGFFVGPLFALARAITAMLSPSEKITEFFGFQSLVAKLSYIAGPLIYGTVSMLTGQLRYAIVSLGILALFGFLALLLVNIKRGLKAVGRF
jgi:UMF1 family MFS transporter